MRFHFTKHAKEKFLKIKKSGFIINKIQVKQTVLSPLKVEERSDYTHIASTLIDDTHVLRVVYRCENDIIVVITFYPGRRKAHEI